MYLSKLSKKELLIKCAEVGIIRCKSKNKTELVNLINNKENKHEDLKILTFKPNNKNQVISLFKNNEDISNKIILVGNDKRIETCKKIGGDKKRKGHKMSTHKRKKRLRKNRHKKKK